MSTCKCYTTLCLSDNVERKLAKEGKKWRTKIAHKFRQPVVPAVDHVDSVQLPRVFGVPLDKLVPADSNEVIAQWLVLTIEFMFSADLGKCRMQMLPVHNEFYFFWGQIF